MKYSVIASFTNGETTGATVTAKDQAQAWEKTLKLFDQNRLYSVHIAAIILPEKEK